MLLLIANPDRMTPLLQGLPDSLQLHAVQLQDHPRDALAPKDGGWAGDAAASTWGEEAQELGGCGRWMRSTNAEQKTAVRWAEYHEGPPSAP